MAIKELPLGDNTFDEIIDQNLLYVDKTKYIYELVKDLSEKNYFLSRPRRFGKSLLLSTLEELFSGRRERFQGLWIGQSDYQFPLHPVIHLSLSVGSETSDLLKTRIIQKLRAIANNFNLKIDDIDSPDGYFESLITALANAAKSKVVILIDEYDAPVTRNMDNIRVAKANARILHDFFAILKSMNKAIRFTFVTGITRYALTSMESGPNHLNDISLDGKYAGICGFTTEEFGPLFADRLETTLAGLKEIGEMDHSATIDDLKKQIHIWYDGYNWTGKTRVFNPYSILNFFDQGSFCDYWIRGGLPGHLTALMRDKPFKFLEPTNKIYADKEIRKTQINNLQPIPVLFHSGFLTVDKVTKVPQVNPRTGEKTITTYYSFRPPNEEVESAYKEDFFQLF